MTNQDERDELLPDEWEESTLESTVAEVVQPTGQVGYLIVLAGEQVGQMVKLGEELVIGRGKPSGFRINDPRVSKEHVRIAPDRWGRIVAQDLSSRNGTYVNGKRVEQKVLEDGDKIWLGSTTILKFSLADQLEEKFQRHMYRAAVRDPLTGLYNRRHLTERLEADVSYSRRHQSPLSVLLLDLDHFKQVNDECGHQAGDAVLAHVARYLADSLRKEDCATRFGGEEFVVVCPGTSAEKAMVVAERVRHTVETQRMLLAQPERVVTISIGVASLPDPEIDSPRALIAAADRALYRAKREGRNRVCRFDVALDGAS